MSKRNKPMTVEMPGDIAVALNIHDHPGWVNPFTTNQAPEAAFTNGTRIVKAKHEPNDWTPLGTRGTVLGSIYDRKLGAAYFVEWDDKPKVAVFVVEGKVEAA